MAGFILPEFGQTITTCDMLADIKAGRTFCPKTQHNATKPYLRPPAINAIKDTIVELVNDPTTEFQHGTKKQYERLLYNMVERRADVTWLMLVVATLKPNHSFFSPDYEPPPRKNTAVFT